MRWRDVYWRLAQGELHLLPSQVDELTMGEILLALDDDTSKPRLPEGFVARSPEEMVLHTRRMRAMSLREKIDRARRG